MAHDLLHNTSTKHRDLKINSSQTKAQILFHQVVSDCDVFTNRCRPPAAAHARVCVRVCACSRHVTMPPPSSFPSRWTRVNTAVSSSASSPRAACAACQSPASALTGPQTHVDSTPTCPSIAQANQLPRQPRSPRACLSVKTNSVLHFTCTAVDFFIHS